MKVCTDHKSLKYLPTPGCRVRCTPLAGIAFEYTPFPFLLRCGTVGLGETPVREVLLFPFYFGVVLLGLARRLLGQCYSVVDRLLSMGICLMVDVDYAGGSRLPT